MLNIGFRIGSSRRLLGWIVVSALTAISGAQSSSALDWEVVTNVRIEIGDGRVIENGTILMADGLIKDVGRNIAIPAGARVTDGQGMTAFPGFIDAFYTKGLKLPKIVEDQDEVPDFAENTLTSMRVANRKGTRPELHAEEYLALTDDLLKPLRKSGFTTAISAPSGAIMNGNSAAVHLADLPKRDAVIKSNIGSCFSFEAGGFEGYPNSLLGVMAHIRQTLYDAYWYQDVARLGGPTPSDDVLSALQPVINRQEPVYFEADKAAEIDRVFKLADEFNLRVVIVGGQEAYKRAEELARRKTPVILSLAYGDEPPKVDENSDRLAKERYRLYEQRVSNAAVLEQAGVPFALFLHDLKGPQELFQNLRKAMEMGLSRDAALKALCIKPCQIVGIADQVGTIEKSKAANLILTDGDFADEKFEVRYLFVKGVRSSTDMPAPPMPEEPDHRHHDGCGCGHEGAR